MIHNPILPGFHPDPSLIRVGDDYYLANSTFEWFPGVIIHHSRDLVHWRTIGHALTRRSQLDMRGAPDSGGIWAPSLSHDGKKFYLIYTNVLTRTGVFKDLHNYLITADKIEGPWSEPIFLNSIGFDASLFHDDDGRKWLVGIRWDHRKGKPRFAGIELQEYSPTEKRLIGKSKTILKKPVLIEGPNLYKRDGWYYLMLAEGGTGWNHGISMARSRSIDGPYELDPQHSVLTSRDDLTLPLQKAGHGELVETQQGEWYLAHLCARPIPPGRHSILGRETAIQKVKWTSDGWLRLEHGGTDAKVDVPAPKGLSLHPWPKPSDRDDFDSDKLDLRWSALRNPVDSSWMSLGERPGWLRLKGRESLLSLFDHSLLARRLQSLDCVAETCMEYSTDDWAQSAGLIAWYDARGHYFLRVSVNDAGKKILGIVRHDEAVYDELEPQLDVDDWKRFFLRATIKQGTIQFAASRDGQTWQDVGGPMDLSHLSDDFGAAMRFTGTMIGVAAHDLTGRRMHADFDYFSLTHLR